MYKAVCKTSLVGDSEKTSSNRKMIEIIAKKANLRAEPNTYGRIVRQAVTGERFVLVGETPDRGWYQIIILESNEIAWIHGNTVKLIGITNKPPAKINSKIKINKRKSAN